MEESQQGAHVDVRSNGQVLIISQSRSSKGLVGGHGKFIKLLITDSDETLGAALRDRLNDRKPGFYSPHMYKEKEAHQARMNEFLEDRGIKSDKVFYKGTKSFSVSEYSDRLEFAAADNSVSGHHPWVKGGPHVVVPHNASNLELAQAMRRTLDFCVA
jgi:hypothetical protein